MASIKTLPVEIIRRIVDIRMDDTNHNIELLTKAQVALAQTNRRFYAIVSPFIQATITCQAAEKGRLDVIKKAHQDGADLNMTGTTKRGQRGTPLHYALMNGHREIVEFLVEVGVDPHISSIGLCKCFVQFRTRYYALHTSLHSDIEGATELLIQKLGAYWSEPDTPIFRDPFWEMTGSNLPKQIWDLLINLPGPQMAGEALRYALDYHKYSLEERILARHDLDVSVRDSSGRTPLWNAVCSGRLKTVKSLLQRPEADAGMAGPNGLTLLHAAVLIRNLSICKALLQRPEVDVTRTDDSGRTPLHFAVFRGELKVLELLLEQPGVDVALEDSQGMTPLHWAVCGRDGGAELWRVLAGMEELADAESYSEIGDYTGECLEIINILLARPEVNAGLHDQIGFTPLHHACLRGDCEAAELLLQRADVDPSARALNGQTPLHIASTSRFRSALTVMNRLLEQPGIKITDCDNDGRTILHYVVECEVVWLAKPVIETALREGVPIDKMSTNGLTAFHQAISIGNHPTARLLLLLGADPMVSKRFKYNNSLLHLCLRMRTVHDDCQDEVVKELISRGIEIDTYTDSPLVDLEVDELDVLEVNIQSADLVTGTDCTPLMWAACRGVNTKIMKMLLNAGADPNAHVIIRDRELLCKTKSNRQAFLSGVFRHAWETGCDLGEIEEHLGLLLKHGSRLDFDGSVDSPLQDACKAAEDNRMSLLITLLEYSTAKNVSQSHVAKVICEYEDKPQHEEISLLLRRFYERLFI